MITITTMKKNRLGARWRCKDVNSETAATAMILQHTYTQRLCTYNPREVVQQTFDCYVPVVKSIACLRLIDIASHLGIGGKALHTMSVIPPSEGNTSKSPGNKSDVFVRNGNFTLTVNPLLTAPTCIGIG